MASAGKRFAGHRRAIDAQRVGFDGAAVGGDEVAFVEQHDVAGDQFGGGNLDAAPGALNLDLRRQQLAQGSDGALGLVFLPEGKNAVDDDHPDDGDAKAGHPLIRVEMIGDERQRGADPQDDRKKMGEFASEAQEQRLAPDFFDVVRSEFAEPARGIGSVEPCRRSFEARQALLDGNFLQVY